MRTVQVYIEGQRLDLFDDEQINVTSTQQNVQDISKVFTDFSQSFSVPASVNNNKIFHHFYQNDIGDFNDVNTLFDFNIRREANIEIDLTPFRTGKVSLEKAEVKNNEPYSYQITFYGELVALKDQFGKDKLVDLTYLNFIKHDYTPTEVRNRITDGSTDYKIRYPLIFDRDVTYGDGLPNDINSTGGAVKFNELFPAIKLFQMLAAITSKYNVSFTGTFLSSKRFQNAFLLCQNSDTFVFNTLPGLADLSTLIRFGNNKSPTLQADDFFDVSNDTLTFSAYNPAVNFPNATPTGGDFTIQNHQVYFKVANVSDASVVYYLDVYVNGNLSQTLELSGNQDETGIAIIHNHLVGQKEFKFFVRATTSLTLTFQFFYRQEAKYYTQNLVNIGNEQTFSNTFAAIASHSISAEISVLNYLPDMTVESFFSGFLKMFNLTCYAKDSNIFQIEPLDDWYRKGAVVDITEYTDIESTKIDRVKLYENIEFKYKESESATNTIFKDLTSRGYGNISQAYPYDGGEFKVELPFENMMMQKFVGTNVQVGETLNTDGNKYTPQPMILYMYDQLAGNLMINEGSGVTSAISQYMPFGQDVLETNLNYTLNLNADISTLLDAVVPNTLFSVYYSPYLSNLYNLKNRETKVKTNLPISLLTNLELNDRVIIRDKRYMINDMKSNLTTGEVSFTLLNDFSDVISGGGIAPIDPIEPSDGAQCLDVQVLLPNKATGAAITTSDPGVTITPSTLTSDGIVNVCIPANTDLLKLIVTEDGADNINTEEFARLRTEEGEVAVYTLTVTYSFSNGTTVASQILIQQQP